MPEASPMSDRRERDAARTTSAADVSMALLAAAAWSLPVAGRASVPLVQGFGEAVARVAVWVVPVVFLLRAARPWPFALRTLGLGAVLALLPLAVLGALLVAKTHHRALGAVTFAALAAAVLLVTTLLARRLALATRAGRRDARRLLGGLVSASVLGTVALALSGGLPSSYAARDGLLGALVLGLSVSGPRWKAPRVLAALGALVFVLAVLAAGVGSRTHLAELVERSPFGVGAGSLLTD
jgi:hypothetical protein